MKLLLTSAGFTNSIISDSLAELAGKPFDQLSLAFIPTAANMEDEDKQWLIEDLYRCKKLGFEAIDVIDVAAIPEECWQLRLQKADVILIGAGDTTYLLEQIRTSGLADQLSKLLDSKVYVGISAGSMIVGPPIARELSEELFGEEGTGLDFVDFLVKPHLNSPYFPERSPEGMKATFTNPPRTAYVLDDNSAVMVDGDKTEVVSEGEWYKFEPKQD